MRRFWFIAAFVFLAAQALAQDAIPGQSFGFDYLTADFANFAVVRFEMNVDGAGWTDIAIPEVADDTNTQDGAHTYKVAIPALTVGSHDVAFRACNATGCGTATAPFAFNMVVFSAPSNVRIIGG